MLLPERAAAGGEGGLLQRKRSVVQADRVVQVRQRLAQARVRRRVALELLVDGLDRGLQDRAVDHRRRSVGCVDALEQVAEGRGLRAALGLGHPGLLQRTDEALTHVGHQPFARDLGVDLPEHACLEVRHLLQLVRAFLLGFLRSLGGDRALVGADPLLLGLSALLLGLDALLLGLDALLGFLLSREHSRIALRRRLAGLPQRGAEARNQRDDHRPGSQHLHAVPPHKLPHLVRPALGRSLERLPVEVPPHVGPERLGAGVSARAILAERLERDPLEFAPQFPGDLLPALLPRLGDGDAGRGGGGAELRARAWCLDLADDPLDFGIPRGPQALRIKRYRAAEEFIEDDAE